MEIKVTDEQNGDTNTTVIECVNDTKWDTPRKSKPIIRQCNERFNMTTKGNQYSVYNEKINFIQYFFRR